jgi:hypothetical protein
VRLLLAGGEDAIYARAAAEHPDLVILDRDRLPGRGEPLIRRLTDLPGGEPICVASDDSSEEGGLDRRRESLIAAVGERLNLARRARPRLTCRARARFTCGSEQRAGRTRDLSACGAFVVTGEPFAPGDQIEIVLDGEGRVARLEAAARVVRVVGAGSPEGRLPGMGLTFLPGAAPDEQAVRLLAGEPPAGRLP